MNDVARQPVPTLLSSHRCIVCVGPGGVGKTSTAAALSMASADAGQRTVVLTIDPAKRLANALGLAEIGSIERPVPASAFEAVDLVAPTGRLSAMMLDIKQAWDEVIERYHPDEERRARLMKNRLYQAMSSALAGSQEYMAMEKLHALATRDTDPLDVIVLDTPPANHALDFLEAPARMVNALDNDATRWLLEPYQNQGRLSRRLFDAGSSFFIRAISKFIGTEMLEDLAELLVGFQGMFDGFRERARVVADLLAAPDTAFVVVSTASPTGVRDAEAFVARLKERHLQVGAIVLNRGTVDPWATAGAGPDPALVQRAVANAGGPTGLADRLFAAAQVDHERAHEEREAASALDARYPDTPVVLVPELTEDVHDLRGLSQMRDALAQGWMTSVAAGVETPT